MARPIRPWFRFYVEAFPDRKIRRLKPAHRWVWVAILGAARESPSPGQLYVAPDMPMSVSELADYADVSLREATDTLRAVEKMHMVTVDENGLITVLNWGRRQFESDDVTKRTQAHRERSKERDRNVPGNAPERGRAFATETETDTEVSTSVGSSRTGTREPEHHIEDEPRSKPISVRSAIISREYCDRVKLSDRGKVAGVVTAAIDGGYDESAIKAALRRLAKDSRPVTPDTLRIEIDGKPGRESKPAYTPPRNGMRGREGW